MQLLKPDVVHLMPGGPVGAVIVGAGLMGRWHAHDLRRAGGRVVAVVDADLRQAERLAGAHRARALASLGEALRDPAAHAVHVCTPTPSHGALIREALEGGRHVLAEKPLTEDPDETDVLLTEAAARGLLLTPVHQFPFQRGMQSLLRNLPGLGPLRHLAGVACSAGARDMDDAGRDRVAGEILPHFLSLLAAFVDEPLGSLRWTVRRSRAGEMDITTVAGQAGVSFRVSMGGRPPRTSWEVTGESGSGHADLFHGFAVVERGGFGRTRKALRPLSLSSRTFMSSAGNLIVRAVRRQPAYPGLRELIVEVYRAVRAGAPGPVSSGEVRDIALARHRILEAILG